MKQQFKSKTIWFNVVMAGIESLHGGMQLFQQILTPEQFVYVSMGIGLAHAMGGMYLRNITTKPISEK